MKLRLLAALCAFVAFVSVSLPAATPAGDLVATVAVPAGLDSAKVRAVVGETFVARNWTVQKTDDGVVARLTHRGHDATITAVLRGEMIELYSDSWKIKKTGERVKREHPQGWIDNLKKDLPKRLARAAVLIE